MNKGEGTTLQVNDGAASAFVAVADVTDIDPGGKESAAIERKRLSNVTSKEKYLGLPDPGELGFGYECTDGNFARMDALFGVPKSWKITFVDGLTLVATGRLRANKPDKVQGEVIVTARVVVVLDTLYAVTDTTP